ncbi:VOC family protein [Nocardia jejuensis]|uniref:VOC family protein n=1 Tax=Nocardia jejuensis TaxID=328049 RepID=UPI000830C98D|nr:VOC family protein [Nocardia jejuensis]
MESQENKEFELRGFNHVGLICDDMERTVEFYSGVLGMPLVKTIELPKMPAGGQQFVFDVGNGNVLTFFWFVNRPGALPGYFNPPPTEGVDEEKWQTRVSAVNHIAFDVPPEKFEEYRERLVAKGIRVDEMNHDNSPSTVAQDVNPDVFHRSLYFQDPDGILLEFACWIRDFGDGDVAHDPRRATDRPAQPVG